MSEHAETYRGIEGVEGREPVGAVLTIGRKDPGRGNPIHNDRFYFVVPTMGADRTRPLHHEFRAFNEAPVEKRQVIRGNLVHDDEADALDWHLKAQVLPGGRWPAHPNKRPACVGDGKLATRYYGETGVDDFREIPCPNELCEFRLGKSKPCKPWCRLYFRVRWLNGTMPETLTKWVNRSWNSTLNVTGFFEYVNEQARKLGLTYWSLYGLPFVLTLSRKTKPSEQTAFPVVSIAPDCDLIAFFLAQREQLDRLGASPETKLLAAGARDPVEADPETVYADYAAITPGKPRKPAESQGQDADEKDEEGGEVSAPAAEVKSPEDRMAALTAQARALGLSDEDLRSIVDDLAEEIVGPKHGGFADLMPHDDERIAIAIQDLARERKRS